MESAHASYGPGFHTPTRPPLRRAAPAEASSGVPFLVAMAGLVLAVAVGAVARFCPEDLRLPEAGATHAAKATTTSSRLEEDKPSATETTASPIAPTTFTTVGDEATPAPAPAPAPKKKLATRSRGRASTTLPDNPYAESDAYGF